MIHYFCLHGIFPFSKSYPEIGNTCSTAKCRRRKSFEAWYYIGICVTLCLSFLSKSKAINVFPKDILKLKERDQSIQAKNELFCHVLVKIYLCNVSWKFFIKIENTWMREIKGQTPQLTLLYCGRTVRNSHRRCSITKAVLNNFAISTGNTCVGVSFLKSYRPKSLQLY